MAATTETVKKEPAEVEVTIAADNHTHNGKLCEKGEKIKVHPDRAEWMLKNKIIEG
ncbi:MAG: DUF7210 family protein [Gammaproteobacteria bacterium]